MNGIELRSVKENHLGSCLLNKADGIKGGHECIGQFLPNYFSLLIDTVISNKEHLRLISKFLLKVIFSFILQLLVLNFLEG